MTERDLEFNPYKINDTLFIKSDNGFRDTILITKISISKHYEKSYSLRQYVWTKLFTGYWERQYTHDFSKYNKNPAGREILTICSEQNRNKYVQFTPIDDAYVQWYGFKFSDDTLGQIDKLLNYPTITFMVGSKTFTDVIVITSTNQEYRTRINFIDKFIGVNLTDMLDLTYLMVKDLQ